MWAAPTCETASDLDTLPDTRTVHVSRRHLLLPLPVALAAATGRGAEPPPPSPAFADAWRDFLRDHPGWRATEAIDELRRAEYGRLAASSQVYLDYTGASLHADSQVRRHADMLGTTLLGNPHSMHLASRNATGLVASARAAVIDHFRVPSDEYLVAFTANATGALKLVGECYPFGPTRRFLLSQDNHNSVAGIGVFAKRAGAAVDLVPVVPPQLRIDRTAALERLRAPGSSRGLFAFPAQSNFSGVRHPLDLVATARAAGWDVLLDAAAFAPTNRLDVAAWRPDFVCVSFYKMFGYPTGVGCLIARRAAVAGWRREWFAGGNVKLASPAADVSVPAGGAAAFEDGTLDFLSLPAVTIGLEHLASVGLAAIHERIGCLTAWTLARIRGLRHRSGRRLVRVLGPDDATDRGGTIAFTLEDPRGRPHDIRRVDARAAAAGIALRSGFFCNPGAGEAAFGLTKADLEPIFKRRRDFTFDDLRADVRAARGIDPGALRASFGIVSDFSDAWRFATFLEEFLDRTTTESGTEPGGRSG